MFTQGAGETGQAEAYFNSRIMRNPRVKSSIARYMGEFVADKSDGGFIKGTQWLVWKFESDSTLSDAMQVCLLTLPKVAAVCDYSVHTSGHAV